MSHLDEEAPPPAQKAFKRQTTQRLSKAGEKSQILARAKRVPITLPKIGKEKDK